MNLHYKFEESGGYDCMTDAFYIYDGEERIAVIDLADFGQGMNDEATFVQVNAAEHYAKVLCGMIPGKEGKQQVGSCA